MRHASRNHASLDDVMRRLNEDFAQQGRFFTEADLCAIIAELVPEFSGVNAFFRDYVEGTRELDYDTALGYVGLRLVRETKEQPALGFTASQSFEGLIQVNAVEPGSKAQQAGLTTDDVLLKLNGRPLHELPQFHLSEMKLGQKVKLEVRQRTRTIEIEFPLATTQETVYHLEEVPHATPEQLQERHGWLSGETTGVPAHP